MVGTTTVVVPHMLFTMQNQHCMELNQKHLTSYKEKGMAFLQQIIAINETWVCNFEPKLKSQRAAWKGKNSPRPQNSNTKL